MCVWGGRGAGGPEHPPLDLGPSDPGTRGGGRSGATPHTLGIAPGEGGGGGEEGGRGKGGREGGGS